MQYGLLIVEGQHDAAVIAKLLSDFNLKTIQNEKKLASYWRPLYANLKFPQKDGDLLKRLDVPIFVGNNTYSVAIRTADSDTKIASALEATLSGLGSKQDQLQAIGIVCDADQQTASARMSKLCAALAGCNLTFAASTPGVVHAGPPRTGIMVFPDNLGPGTLETLLEDCAATHYPQLQVLARNYMTDGAGHLDESERRNLEKGANRQKATIAVIGALLQPGASIAVTLRQDRWLTGSALAQPRIAALRTFLKDLLDLP
ncbi:MAG TPA: hypothetical protein PKM96_09630 [Accumulibacter sp.]|nr:hypothetical protein [Accumulibacter sp.]